MGGDLGELAGGVHIWFSWARRRGAIRSMGGSIWKTGVGKDGIDSRAHARTRGRPGGETDAGRHKGWGSERERRETHRLL